MTILDECWEWNGYRNIDGYGKKLIKYKRANLHRVAWEWANGPIPDGIMVLHRCDNPPCVNPAHLFLGTAKDNAQDMLRKGRHYLQKLTHCKRGHAFDEANTRLSRYGGKVHRICRACNRIYCAKKRAKKNLGDGL